MTASASPTALSNPKGDERVPSSTLSYFEARNRFKVYDLVMDEFRKSGLTQASLARRLGISPPQLNRMLKSPGNWTLDTISNLLFAIRGGEPKYGVRYPLEEVATNEWQPEFIQTRNNAKSSGRFNPANEVPNKSGSTASEFRISKKLETT